MALLIASAVSLRADEPLTLDRKILSVTVARAIVAVAEERRSRVASASSSWWSMAQADRHVASGVSTCRSGSDALQ
jgi:hypothetical protein